MITIIEANHEEFMSPNNLYGLTANGLTVIVAPHIGCAKTNQTVEQKRELFFKKAVQEGYADAVVLYHMGYVGKFMPGGNGLDVALEIPDELKPKSIIIEGGKNMDWFNSYHMDMFEGRTLPEEYAHRGIVHVASPDTLNSELELVMEAQK